MHTQVAPIVRGPATLRRLSSQALTHFSPAATRQFPAATCSVCGSVTEFPPVCGYATLAYSNVLWLRFRDTVSCPSQTQKRLHASSLLRAFLYSVCGSAAHFRPACPTRKKVRLPTAAFQHFRLVLLLCPPWCSQVRVPHLLLLPLPPTLSGFRSHLLLLTTWCSRVRLSHTDTLSLSPSPTLTHTHSPSHSHLHSLPLHSHSYTVLNCNLWLYSHFASLLRSRWCYSPLLPLPWHASLDLQPTSAYDIHSTLFGVSCRDNYS